MKNRAAYMVGLNKMEIRETPVPEPKAGEVLVKMLGFVVPMCIISRTADAATSWLTAN